jgi:hypothetical protein
MRGSSPRMTRWALVMAALEGHLLAAECKELKYFAIQDLETSFLAALSFICRAPILAMPAARLAMAINGRCNKPIGPGGSTRHLHQMLLKGGGGTFGCRTICWG